VRSNTEALRLAWIRFDVGQIDLLDVLQLQMQLIQSQSARRAPRPAHQPAP